MEKQTVVEGLPLLSDIFKSKIDPENNFKLMLETTFENGRQKNIGCGSLSVVFEDINIYNDNIDTILDFIVKKEEYWTVERLETKKEEFYFFGLISKGFKIIKQEYIFRPKCQVRQNKMSDVYVCNINHNTELFHNEASEFCKKSNSVPKEKEEDYQAIYSNFVDTVRTNYGKDKFILDLTEFKDSALVCKFIRANENEWKFKKLGTNIAFHMYLVRPL